MVNKINQIIEDQRDEIIQALSGLVQIPSETGQEGEAQKYMQDLYSKLGLKVVAFEPDIDKLKQHKAFRGTEFDYKDRPNVLGIFEGKPSARSIKLNAHVDVVTPEPVKDWDFSPWGGKIEGNRLHGRGACDDKSGLIANYFALESLLKAGVKPEGTVILESVVEEESGGAGSLASLLEGYTADGIIFTDSGPAIVVAIGGIDYFDVSVKGRAAHAGWAEIGVNAILKMNKLCQALAELDEKRHREVHYPLFEKGGRKVSCNLNIGTYKGGDSM